MARGVLCTLVVVGGVVVEALCCLLLFSGARCRVDGVDVVTLVGLQGLVFVRTYQLLHP